MQWGGIMKNKDKTFHITISELTAKTVEVKAKDSDMAWVKYIMMAIGNMYKSVMMNV